MQYSPRQIFKSLCLAPIPFLGVLFFLSLATVMVDFSTHDITRLLFMQFFSFLMIYSFYLGCVVIVLYPISHLLAKRNQLTLWSILIFSCLLNVSLFLVLTPQTVSMPKVDGYIKPILYISYILITCTSLFYYAFLKYLSKKQ